MNPEDITLSERSQTQKDDSTYVRSPEGSDSYRQKEDGGTQGLGKGNGKLVFNGVRGSLWKVENVLEMDGGDSCKTM